MKKLTLIIATLVLSITTTFATGKKLSDIRHYNTHGQWVTVGDLRIKSFIVTTTGGITYHIFQSQIKGTKKTTLEVLCESNCNPVFKLISNQIDDLMPILLAESVKIKYSDEYKNIQSFIVSPDAVAMLDTE